MNTIEDRVVFHSILENEANVLGDGALRLVRDGVKTRLDRSEVHGFCDNRKIVGKTQSNGVYGRVEDAFAIECRMGHETRENQAHRLEVCLELESPNVLRQHFGVVKRNW